MKNVSVSTNVFWDLNEYQYRSIIKRLSSKGLQSSTINQSHSIKGLQSSSFNQRYSIKGLQSNTLNEGNLHLVCILIYEGESPHKRMRDVCESCSPLFQGLLEREVIIHLVFNELDAGYIQLTCMCHSHNRFS